MDAFYNIIWHNVCFLRLCTGLFFIYLLHFVWNNNIYNIRKNINHIKKNSENFFSPDGSSIANLFGGINESFIRNSLCKYVELLDEIHKNKIMTQIPLTINQKDVFFCSNSEFRN